MKLMFSASSKGKEHKEYEFGDKVSIIRSATGVISGAGSFRNEYNGHLKTDYRFAIFTRKYQGDAINVMLAVAAYNFKRATRLLLWLFNKICETIFGKYVALKYTFLGMNKYLQDEKYHSFAR